MRTLDSFWKTNTKPIQLDTPSSPSLEQADEQRNNDVEVINIDDDFMTNTHISITSETASSPCLVDSSFDNASVKNDQRKTYNLKDFLSGKGQTGTEVKRKNKRNTKNTKIKINEPAGQMDVPPDNYINTGASTVEIDPELPQSTQTIHPSFTDPSELTNNEKGYLEIVDTDLVGEDISRQSTEIVDTSLMAARASDSIHIIEQEFLDPELIDTSAIDLSMDNDDTNLFVQTEALPTKKITITNMNEAFSSVLSPSKSFNKVAKVTSLSNLLSGGPKKVKRMNKISLEKCLPCDRFPKIQNVVDLGDGNSNVARSSKSTLEGILTKKKENPQRMQVYGDSPGAYAWLNGSSSRNNEKRESGSKVWSIPVKHTTEQWDSLYKPQNVKDMVLDKSIQIEFPKHLSESFQKLTKQTTRKKLKNYKKMLQAIDCTNEMDDFIVPDEEIFYDYENEDNQTPLDDYVPIIIIYGDTVGKNCLLTTSMKDIDIFEVNTSSNRGRRQIMEMCTEAVTSQFVNKNNKNNGTFNVINNKTVKTQSKGVILFDDVDVLFKKRDKNFWVVVNRLLEISRIPIVLTCKDLSCIPRNILAICELENGLFQLTKPSLKSCVSYISKKLDSTIPEEVIELTLSENNGDIRQSLLQLQYISSLNHYTIEHNPLNRFDFEKTNGLPEISEYYDKVSACEVMVSATKYKSLFTHDLDTTLFDPENLNEDLNFNSTAKTLSNVTAGTNSKPARSTTNLSNMKNGGQNTFASNNDVEDDDVELLSDCLVNSVPMLADSNNLQERTILEKETWADLIKSLNISEIEQLFCDDESSPQCTSFNQWCDFFSSKITRFVSNRPTRNKRKYKDILNNLNSTMDNDDYENDCKEQLLINYPSWRTINEDILPTIRSMAMRDKQTRDSNLKKLLELRTIYENYTDEEILRYMEEEHLLQKIYFTKDPSKVDIK